MTRSLFVALCIACVTGLVGMHAVDAQPSLELRPGAIDPVSGERFWFDHEEFARFPLLRTRFEQPVLIRLGGAGSGSTLQRSIPYIVAEEASYEFCIPATDAHVASARLYRVPSDAMVAAAYRGLPCKMLPVPPGLYRLDIEIDRLDSVAVGGANIFVHVPRARADSLLDLPAPANRAGASGDPLLTSSSSASFPSTCPTDLDGTYSFTIAGLNGTFSSHAFFVSGQSVTFKLIPYPVFTTNGFYMCADASGLVRMQQNWLFGNFTTVFLNPLSSGDVNVYQGRVSTAPTPFKVTDLGNGNFTLAAQLDGTLYPIVLGPNTTLQRAAPGTPPVVFTMLFRYDLLGPHVYGTAQAALYGACNYPDSFTDPSGNLHGSALFYTSIPDLSQITDGGTTLDNFAASMRLASLTVATLYANANYSGVSFEMTKDTPCLSATPLGNGTASSLKVVSARQFIISTNRCQNCNLSGIDLSNLSLTGGNFAGSTFTGGNLTNTNFQSATLDATNFNGAGTSLQNTNLIGALVHCANFSGADLRTARFYEGSVVPVLTKDFSCRFDVTGGMLEFNTFDQRDWRYLNLTGATIVGIAGSTLSTTTTPLDLSNALMGQVSMPRVNLTAANLTGATFTRSDLTNAILDGVTSTPSSPTVFNGTTLTQASFKGAKLSGSFFRGATMSPVNLGNADLSGAWLEADIDGNFGAVNLSRSYMLNTNLSGAHLTNATLDFVSWYNVNPASPIASGAGAFLTGASFNIADLPGLNLTGAFLQSATLTNTQLIGAILTNAHLEPNGATRTNLSVANLRGANLANANFTNANLQNAGVSPTPENEVYLEVLKDPDHFQQPLQYQFFAVNRPATTLGSGASGTVTNGAVCPSGVTGPCGDINASAWVAPNPPQEPSDCVPTYDNQGNIISVTCTSNRHPTM